MTLKSELERQVASRADNRCEYCGMHQSLQGATFHVEHITPRSVGGESELDNLAWACPSCNLRKSDRTDVVDAETGQRVPFFNPRIHDWHEHFRWDGYEVVGVSDIGRAAVDSLDLNHVRRVRIRQAEETFDLWPP